MQSTLHIPECSSNAYAQATKRRTERRETRILRALSQLIHLSATTPSLALANTTVWKQYYPLHCSARGCAYMLSSTRSGVNVQRRGSNYSTGRKGKSRPASRLGRPAKPLNPLEDLAFLGPCGVEILGRSMTSVENDRRESGVGSSKLYPPDVYVPQRTVQVSVVRDGQFLL